MRRLPGFVSPFSYRPFRLLWTGAFLSSIGTWTQDVAVAWFIHTHVADPLYLGLRAAASDLPLIAFMAVGGAAADRVDRRRILLTSNALQMTFALVLAVLYLTGHLGVVPILLVAFFTGLAQSQSAPTYQAVLTSLVPAQEIPRAVALNSLQFNLSRFVGPAIAGVLLVKGGTGTCFLVNAVSFLAVMAALWQIQLPGPAPRAAQDSLGRSLLAGFAEVRRNELLGVFTLLAITGTFFSFPLITYLPVIAGDVLKTGARGYSQLLAAFGAGAIAGAVATAQRGHAPGRGKTLLLALTAYGAAVVAALLASRQVLSMAFLFVAGASLVTAFSTLNSLVQEQAPDAFRGRILGIYGLAFRGGMPLGSLVAGIGVRSFGAPRVLGSFSVALALISGVLFLRHQALRRI